jgi:hypothetical protein
MVVKKHFGNRLEEMFGYPHGARPVMGRGRNRREIVSKNPLRINETLTFHRVFGIFLKIFQFA